MKQLAQAYETLSPELNRVLGTLKEQISDLLVVQGIMIHSVTGRVKSPSSFKRKIARPDKTYNELWDVTDLIGLRIITYYEDTIETIGQLIEKEFDVDYLHSQNKLRLQDHEKFGYRSLHYICYLPKEKNLLASARFEIQIRTVLQHAWAEIEHDLGYKASEEIPPSMRRRFSQVAGLLEVADREFVSLREGISSYENSLVKKKADFENASLDIISLKALIDSALVREIDEEIMKYLRLSRGEEFFFPDYLVKALHAAGLSQLKNIRDAIASCQKDFVPFLGPYFKFAKNQWGLDSSKLECVQKGYSLLFIAHLIVINNSTLKLDKVSALTDFYQKIDYPDQVLEASNAARKLLEQLEK